MRILVIAGWMFPDAEGGSFRAVYESARGLERRGHLVTVLTQKLDSNAPREEKIDGIRVSRYSTLKRNSFLFFLTVIGKVFWRSFFLKRRFDVVQAHHLVPAFGLSLANLFYQRRPLIYNFHMARFLEFEDEEIFESRDTRKTLRIRLFSWVLRRMESFVIARAKRIVVYSEYTRGLINRYFPRAISKVVLIRPGVDLARFYPAEKIRAKAGLKLGENHFIILSVRRLEPRMGLENLIEAVARIKTEIPQIQLIIVGRGSLEERLKEQARELGIESLVQFKSWVNEEELVQYYQAADLFVLPTRALEGFGFVILESLSCGTPVLGTPVGAIPEVLEPLGKSFLFKDKTSEAIASGLMNFVRSAFGNSNFRMICRKYVEENYSWQKHIEKLEEVMETSVCIR